MNRKSRIAARAEDHVAAGAFSGIEWAVTRGGEIWEQGRTGLADATTGRAMADVPVYRIYSMTKPIVSAVLMMLFEEGKLRLMDPLAAYIPAFSGVEVLEADGSRRKPAGWITIEHLLTHRAGFSYSFLHASCPVGNGYRGTGLLDADKSLEEVCEGIATHPIAFDPGTSWRYSVATDVVGRVIEVVEGKPLQDVLAERVFAPLGLTDTGFSLNAAQQDRLMAMFGQEDIDKLFEFGPGAQKLTPANVEGVSPLSDPGFARGGLGLFSTLPDYLKIAQFLRDGLGRSGEVLISRKGLEWLWTDRIPAHQKPMALGPIMLWGYGYSLAGRVLSDPGQALGLSSLGECGWAGAASTYFWIDPAEDMIGVVMSQYLGSKIPLADDMRVAVYQALE